MNVIQKKERVPAKEVHDKILAAAERVMSEKGPKNSSIAEIAKLAGVTDSLIYNYFEGKDDLLFSIPGKRMLEVLQGLNDQLQGILDPSNRLTKMVWFHLHYNQTHREYARLLLLECRSNRAFYGHEAYGLIRQYARIMKTILDEGVEKGVFRPDMNTAIVRDVILGTLDWELLGLITLNEIENMTSDFDALLDLILPMVLRGDSKDEPVDKWTQIFRSAERVFAEKGYEQAKITEIAQLSQISEGAIYQHFKSKQDLLLSIAKKRFEEHTRSLQEIFEIKSTLRKLRRLIRFHFLIYLTQSDFLRVFLLHIQLNSQFYDSEAFPIFEEYIQLITNVLEEGKKDGSIRASANPRVFRNMFLGSFAHVALRWMAVENRKPIDKMVEIDQVVTLLCRAVSNTRE